MDIYLLSNNSKYIKYWKGSIQKIKFVDLEEVSQLLDTDILIVDNEVYDHGFSTQAKIIVLDSEPTFEKCITLLKKGVKAYGNVYMHASHILSAIESLRDDKVWMYPNFIANMIGISKKNNEDILQKKLDPLTQREKEIAKLILDGLTNKEIAMQLEISINTIKIHTKNIYNKLSVNDRLSLFSLLK